jgi:hypothetical protein
MIPVALLAAGTLTPLLCSRTHLRKVYMHGGIQCDLIVSVHVHGHQAFTTGMVLGAMSVMPVGSSLTLAAIHRHLGSRITLHSC